MSKRKKAGPLKHTAHFRVESRLLEELGERLVQNAETALIELIKNSYDADARKCRLTLPAKNHLRIADDGHGMTEAEFTSRWMVVATSSKAIDRVSRIYKRPVSGSKGVGRFAARFLGDHLTLTTVADDPKAGRCKLIATFDWEALRGSGDLAKLTVTYTVETGIRESTGTTLDIRKLKVKVDDDVLYDVRSNTLHIASPLAALQPPDDFFPKSEAGEEKAAGDRGFAIYAGADQEDEKDKGKYNDKKDTGSIAGNVLANAYARVHFEVKNNHLEIDVHFEGRRAYKSKIDFPNDFTTPVYGDIRFFPRRGGIFRNKGFQGFDAWEWVKDNSGVAVVDHGFRIQPYGLEEDDWLTLSADKARNFRKWRSELMRKRFPMSKEVESRPSLNPMLYLPANLQLVGAVFIETVAAGKGRRSGLIASMDRQGLQDNQAFKDLYEITRFSTELIAYFDKKFQTEKDEAKATQIKKEAKQALKEAIAYIEKADNLSRPDKNRLIKSYSDLYQNYEEFQEYTKKSKEELEVMSSLGILAGFMTHEFQVIVHSVEGALKTLERAAKRVPEIKDDVKTVRETLGVLQEHDQYVRLFVSQGAKQPNAPYKSRAQVKMVTDLFHTYAARRHVKLELEVESSVEAPLVPIAMYSGMLVNLYTNALKALVQQSNNPNPVVRIAASNDKKFHQLYVMDNGVGIPDSLRSRIWDPLYTTTSQFTDPLGSGMGLGLPLVKRLIEAVGGKIELLDTAPDGFSTCFHVIIPRVGHG